MKEEINQILLFYDMKVKSAESLDDDNDTFKLIDNSDNQYFLKIYGKSDDYDIIPGERVYDTYEQIQLESEILLLLSDSILKTAVPLKNKNGDFVTTLNHNLKDNSIDSNDKPIFATITTFIEGAVNQNSQPPTIEMAYLAGVSAAQLHLESKKKLLPIAVKRLHKRQDYILKIKGVLSQGAKSDILTGAQYEMVSQCCDVVIDCMNRLDEEIENNVGLVHTDIRNTNIVYTQNHAILIDFSRSVYSYYLYDLAEMCLHGNFGGSSPQLQNAILRGYHSVIPLTKYNIFAMQVFFAMFILTIMAEVIGSKQSNPWLESVLKWFADEVHPGLVSGKGYLEPSAYENILVGSAIATQDVSGSER